MLFDMYNERLQKKIEQVEDEVAEDAENENSEDEFTPTNNYPNA